MNIKLTLRLDDDLIRLAKRHSRKSGKSVSRLVAEYFELIGAVDETPNEKLPPRVLALLGALTGAREDERAYRAHLERKHR